MKLPRPIGLVSWIQPEPLLAVVLWGGIYPGAKIALQEIPFLSFTSLRLVLAAVLLFILSARSRRLRDSWDLRGPFLNAGLAQTAFQGLLLLSLQRTTAGNSALLLAAAPLLVASWLALARREILPPRQWSGLVFGVAGVSLIVQASGLDFGKDHLIGNFLALGAAAAWGWYGLAIGPLVSAVGALRATGWTMVLASIVFLPLALPEVLSFPWSRVSWEGWAALAYGSIAGPVVAMTLWGRSIHRLGPNQTMVYVYLEPLSAVAIAAVLLGESLSALQAVGAVLIFLAVWLARHERS